MKKKIKRFLKLRKEFGLRNAFMLAVLNLSHNDAKYIDFACSILFRKFKEKIKLINDGKRQQIVKPTIWSFWWQGIDSLPEVLKVTYESHKKHIVDLGYNYVFIDKSNLNEYLEIPDYIFEKVENGVISFTHFSDYIRIALLEKYGGAWIDITLLMVGDLPKDLFDHTFYSFNLHGSKYRPAGLGQKITKCKWAGFMLSTNEVHNPLLRYVKDSLELFWKSHNFVIDYFLMNLIIKIAYDNNSYAKELIDSIPQNNLHLYDLVKVINSPKDEKILSEIENMEVFFKVTQKMQMIDVVDGIQTFYGYYMSRYLV